MTQRQITVDDIMSTADKPCYTREKIEGLFDGLPFVTVNQIATCEIYDHDKIWVLLQLLKEKLHVREFSKKCAGRTAVYYADSADYAAAAYDADSADYAAAYCYAERGLQIKHLLELHKKEERGA